MGKPWLKLWTEALYDKKLRRTSPVNRWVWIALLMMAAEQDDSGKLEVTVGIPMTDEDIRESAAVEMSAWMEARDYFLQMDMLRFDEGMYTIKNYVKRQEPKDPTAAERMRRMREAEAAAKALAAAGRHPVQASGEMADAWREAVGVEPTPGLLRSMQAAEKKYGLEEVLAAIEITGEAGKTMWSYTAGVLKNKAEGTGKPNGHAEKEYSMDDDPLMQGIDWSQFHKTLNEEERARMTYGDAFVDMTNEMIRNGQL